MDDKLAKALDFSNYMITLDNQKRILKEQHQDNLLHYYNGGRFRVSQELITFCFILNMRDQESTVIVDDNDIPIEVNIDEFLADISDVYFTATNQYLTEYNKLKNNRSVEGIFDD
jgi:hypothetical protein